MPHSITPKQLADRLAEGNGVYLLDVRNPDEYAVARLRESVLIPLPELSARVNEVDPNAGDVIVVYCHHGIRSISGAAILERAGLGPAYSLSGGIDAWSTEIDPTVPRY